MFYDCSALASITIPSNVTSIASSVFYSCINLTNIIIPDSVTNIGASAFYSCIKLPNIIIPNKVTSISSNAFYDCFALTSIMIPNNVCDIGSFTFANCTKLSNVSIGNGVISIGDSAFEGCTNLISVTIPSKVISIGSLAFGSCQNLTSIVLTNGLSSIGERAFVDCERLTSVTIPNSVTNIESGAFALCYSLTSFIVGNCVTSIGDDAFAYCGNLSGVYFKGNAPSLGGANVFNNCNIATVYYLPGAAGWSATFGDRPTAVWPLPYIGLSGDLAFGSVFTNTTATSTLTITNSGNSSLTVSGISYPAGFSGAWAGSIPINGSQDVTVTFAPTAATSYSGTVTVNSDAISGVNTASASGTGIVPTRIIWLGGDLSGGDLSFGGVLTNTTATRTLFIGNGGNSPLTVSGINYPAGFSGAWSGSLPPNGLVPVTATFSPTAATSYGGTVTANSDATSGGNTIIASGTGVGPSRIIGLGGSLAFGSVLTNTTATNTLTIANSGNSPLTVSGISYPAGFSGAWSGSLPPNGSQNVTVTFAPTAATSYSGTVTVNSDATSGVTTTIASGAGVATPTASFTASPVSGSVPLLVTFTDNSTGTITNRVWSFGDGTTNSTTTDVVAHTYSTPSTNTVTLTVFGPAGTSSATRNNYIMVTNPATGIHYVSASSTTPVSPYVSWATAALRIQDAVDVATNGEMVLVNNGFYNTGGRAQYPPGSLLTNRVAVYKSIILISVNGPSVTSIVGAKDPVATSGNGNAATRCIFLTNGAMLVGFTLTNGHTRTDDISGSSRGGGVYCDSYGVDGFVSNCVFNANSAYGMGGGAYYPRLGSGTYGTLNNCVFTGNTARNGGGAFTCFLTNCTLTGNTATYGGGASSCTLNNCTLTGNTATYGGGTSSCTLNNCIVYFNTASGYYNNIYSGTATFTCTTPDPGGAGNTTNDPGFVNAAAGNYRLLSNSPCINAGTNQPWMVGTTDLDGNPRIVNATVDIGAYEYQYANMPPLALFSADQTSGVVPMMVTFTDTSTGVITNRNWVFGDGSPATNISATTISHTYTFTGTNTVSLVVSGPLGASTNMLLIHTKALVLGLFPPSFNSSTNGNQLTLQLTGTPNYPYVLQSATNLTPPINWQTILTNSSDTNGNWQFTDTNLNGGQKFYRAVGQ